MAQGNPKAFKNNKNYGRYQEFERAVVLFLFKNLTNNTVPNITRITGYGKSYIDNTIDRQYKR